MLHALQYKVQTVPDRRKLQSSSHKNRIQILNKVKKESSQRKLSIEH